MRLATWNVNSISVRLPQVLHWLASSCVDVDVLALQELKLPDEQFPYDAMHQAGYHSVVHGQKTYNGVALLSRQPLHDVVRNIPGFADPQARMIAATLPTPNGALRLVNGYFVNGQAPGSDKFDYKMRWLHALTDWLADELKRYPQLVLMGDFNIVPEDRDSFDPQGLHETLLHTTAERAHFQALLALGLHDAFRLTQQAPHLFSWWDYRMRSFARNHGLRIDHILTSSALVSQVRACCIDRQPRHNPRPSDHAPVIVTLHA